MLSLKGGTNWWALYDRRSTPCWHRCPPNESTYRWCSATLQRSTETTEDETHPLQRLQYEVLYRPHSRKVQNKQSTIPHKHKTQSTSAKPGSGASRVYAFRQRASALHSLHIATLHVDTASLKMSVAVDALHGRHEPAPFCHVVGETYIDTATGQSQAYISVYHRISKNCARPQQM